MTKKEYYELALKLWSDIVENGYLRKEDSRYFKDVENMDGECPLFEFFLVWGKKRELCKSCPLNINDQRCCNLNQPFDIWENRKIKPAIRIRAASKILKLIQDDFNKLWGENG